MKSPHYITVEPKDKERYSVKKKIKGSTIITSASDEDSDASNRKAVVLSLPLGYKGEIQEGDTILVHHNVFKHHNDISGKRVNGRSYFDEGKFLIDTDEYYMYERNGEWRPVGRFCFVKPIPLTQSKGLHNSATFHPLRGEMIYPNENLISKGIKKGDIVGFAPYSEYKFEVDGEILYRVFDHLVTVKH